MFEFLTTLAYLAFGLSVLSATGIVAVHIIFGPALPPRIQELTDLFMSILNASAKLILGPFEFIKRITTLVAGNPPPSGRRSMPESGVKKIVKR